MKKLFYILPIGAFILAACGGSVSRTASQNNATLAPVPAEYTGKTNPLGADAATEGAQVFHINCEACHGVAGHGDGPAGQALDPHPENLAELQTIVNDDYLYWRINEGKPGTAMVAWKDILSDEQIWQVVSFIRTLE